MSSSSLSNLIKLDVKGMRSFDLWLSPKARFNFKRKPEIRLNGRPLHSAASHGRSSSIPSRCSTTSASAAIGSRFTGTG